MYYLQYFKRDIVNYFHSWDYSWHVKYYRKLGVDSANYDDVNVNFGGNVVLATIQEHVSLSSLVCKSFVSLAKLLRRQLHQAFPRRSANRVSRATVFSASLPPDETLSRAV